MMLARAAARQQGRRCGRRQQRRNEEAMSMRVNTAHCHSKHVGVTQNNAPVVAMSAAAGSRAGAGAGAGDHPVDVAAASPQGHVDRDAILRAAQQATGYEPVLEETAEVLRMTSKKGQVSRELRNELAHRAANEVARFDEATFPEHDAFVRERQIQVKEGDGVAVPHTAVVFNYQTKGYAVSVTSAEAWVSPIDVRKSRNIESEDVRVGNDAGGPLTDMHDILDDQGNVVESVRGKAPEEVEDDAEEGVDDNSQMEYLSSRTLMVNIDNVANPEGATTTSMRLMCTAHANGRLYVDAVDFTGTATSSSEGRITSGAGIPVTIDGDIAGSNNVPGLPQTPPPVELTPDDALQRANSLLVFDDLDDEFKLAFYQFLDEIGLDDFFALFVQDHYEKRTLQLAQSNLRKIKDFFRLADKP